MVSIYQVDPNELIKKVSKELEGFNEIKAPEWAKFAKTGHSRERPPEDPNWWYTRFAAVLRSIYKLGPIGVSKLRTKYGGKKNRGVKPEHFYKGSGNILRKILQQGETAGLLKQTIKGVHKGRILTPKGKSLLDRVALSILKEKPVSTTKLKEKPIEKPKKEEQPIIEKLKKIIKLKPKKVEKPTKRTPEKLEKISEVEKEVKEIEKNKKEKTKKIKDKEEIKKVEEIVKKLTIKKIKEQKKK
jgi:small subunit ribosomal protein S19e